LLSQPTDTFTAGTVCPEDSDKEMSMSTLRMLKYHALEDGVDMGANYFRAGAHADFDVLTLLFAAQAGLELCPGRKISTEFGYGDKWYPIACNKYEICCNLGDQLMRWSDDKLKSTFHRVTCPRPGVDAYLGDRYS
jgi:isopenicillin N synthase-like dioxygenase